MDENYNSLDTSAFNINLTVPVPEIPQVDLSSSIQPVDLNTAASLMPDTSYLVDMAKNDILIQQRKLQNSTLDSIINNSSNKLSTTGSSVSIWDSHDRLNDGTFIPKYEYYTPGIDNEDYFSKRQTSTEKFLNPVGRFFSNTSKGLLDIGAFVYGVGSAAIQGRFDAIYDNDYSKYVDDLTTRTNGNYKNFYSKEEREQGLGFDLQTLDKVLGERNLQLEC